MAANFSRWTGSPRNTKVVQSIAQINTQRKSIVEKIAPNDPQEAFELIWQFLSLADSIFERSHDSSGMLIEGFMSRAKTLAV